MERVRKARRNAMKIWAREQAKKKVQEKHEQEQDKKFRAKSDPARKKEAVRRKSLVQQYNDGPIKRAKSWSTNTHLAPTPPPDDAYSVD